MHDLLHLHETFAIHATAAIVQNVILESSSKGHSLSFHAKYEVLYPKNVW